MEGVSVAAMFTSKLHEEALKRELSERTRHVVASDNKTLRLLSRSGQVVKLDYACHSQAGADPNGRTKQNQDTFVVEELLGNSNSCFFGVFDGHGSDGGKVSRYLVSTLPRLIAGCDAFRAGRVKEAFQTQIPLCNRQLSACRHINCRLSGSTAITALLQDNGLLLVGNVGDSRCMLGRVKDGTLQVAALNTDHNPDVPAEAERIIKRGGRIAPYVFEGESVGPRRVWLRNEELPRLSMTRALGDQLGATVGVSAEPEITQVMLTPQDRYLVLCSDGIFEFMDNEVIMSIVHQQVQNGWSPKDIAKCLVAEANRRWRVEEDGIIDDCTIILILLEMTPKGPATPPQEGAESQPISSVARAMNDIARQTSNLLSPDAAIHRSQSLGKLGLKLSR